MEEELLPLPIELEELLGRTKTALESLETDTESIDQEAFKLESNQIQAKIEEAELLADECEDEKTRSHALKIVQEYSNRFTRLKAKFRLISLKLKRTNTTYQSQRAELLKGSSTTSSSEIDPSSSSDVTKSLQNTLEIMRQELDRSVMSTHLLEQQTSTLQLTSDQYMNFGDLMKTSKALISSLKRADIIDRILLTGALTFFGLVCLYILKKRILDKGVSIISTLISPLSRMDNSRENSIDKTNPIYDQDLVLKTVITTTAAIATATAIARAPNPIPSPDIHLPPTAPSSLKISSSQDDLLHEEL
ncbi:hypothetical protein KEM48_003989 [Puccinia striiformis f. sp. tritici PST-130]|uniref:Sec20 C-terminal domain-containing protein n=1 Tax=Puccinia striiformis f. sp. tritici PST-78 TaxID=1165861 RepID=A0A0L0UR16_9BASI|nr:hypothetical protein Pst134EB_014811 [Puccinia striiformis f. sp. tritici]KAI9612913.1 hypothetical protein KEM48_003989 [Puccinia striiformis f. sp. tritici PST-130]KNE89366.1 hypothetical protein PSTG_17174 [Puccinia striiformis f. sp. tritici PST-78]